GYDGPVDGEAMAEPMRFVAGPGGALTAIGRIDIGTAASFQVALDDSAVTVRSLHLHSPGGSVEDAMAMARLVREKRIDTHVPADAYCASACPLLFAGGDERRVGEGAWVGLHQVYAVALEGVPRVRDIDASISDIQATIAECQQLLVDMGVAPEIWIKAMKTPPDALYVLTEEELRTSGMVTRERFGPPMPASLRRSKAGDENAASPVEASSSATAG
ncbi:MAG: ATP-dependent Clp protease proteolytic subunit, partial [Rhizobiaceae bacterium]|nr:ATP-dependent Clp protease proteolytic subunit [Rhizobiaceae bacterium]